MSANIVCDAMDASDGSAAGGAAGTKKSAKRTTSGNSGSPPSKRALRDKSSDLMDLGNGSPAPALEAVATMREIYVNDTADDHDPVANHEDNLNATVPWACLPVTVLRIIAEKLGRSSFSALAMHLTCRHWHHSLGQPIRPATWSSRSLLFGVRIRYIAWALESCWLDPAGALTLACRLPNAEWFLHSLKRQVEGAQHARDLRGAPLEQRLLGKRDLPAPLQPLAAEVHALHAAAEANALERCALQQQETQPGEGQAAEGQAAEGQQAAQAQPAQGEVAQALAARVQERAQQPVEQAARNPLNPNVNAAGAGAGAAGGRWGARQGSHALRAAAAALLMPGRPAAGAATSINDSIQRLQRLVRAARNSEQGAQAALREFLQLHQSVIARNAPMRQAPPVDVAQAVIHSFHQMQRVGDAPVGEAQRPLPAAAPGVAAGPPHAIAQTPPRSAAAAAAAAARAARAARFGAAAAGAAAGARVGAGAAGAAGYAGYLAALANGRSAAANPAAANPAAAAPAAAAPAAATPARGAAATTRHNGPLGSRPWMRLCGRMEEALHAACDADNLGAIAFLHEQLGLTSEQARSRNNFAVRMSAFHRRINIIQYLLDKLKLGPNDLRSNNNYALRMACDNGDVDMVRLLMASGLEGKDLRANDNEGICAACVKGHTAVVRFIAEGGYLTHDDLASRGHYALRSACWRGHLDIVRLLVQAGLTNDDLQRENFAVIMAMRYEHRALLHYLVRERGLPVPASAEERVEGLLASSSSPSSPVPAANI